MVMSRNLCGHQICGARSWLMALATATCVFGSRPRCSVPFYRAKCLRSRPLSARITSDRIKSPRRSHLRMRALPVLRHRPAGGVIKEESGVESRRVCPARAQSDPGAKQLNCAILNSATTSVQLKISTAQCKCVT